MFFIVFANTLIYPVFAQSPTCAYCGEPILGYYVTIDGKPYHEACSWKILPRCAICGKMIESNYVRFEGKDYHRSCYYNEVAPRCDVCGEPLSGKYRTDFWGLKYHIEHEAELPRCDYCMRLISEGTTGGGRIYSDGRHLCNICFETAVMADSEVKSARYFVLGLLHGNGIDFNKENIDISLVDVPSLKQVSGADFDLNEMGFCKFEFTLVDKDTIEKNNTIYILSGLPELVFKGVLAHEMMHAWMNLSGIHDLPLDICEGSANYASYLVYATNNDKFAEYLIKNLDENPDPVYGEGFRKVKAIVSGNGINNWLKYLRDQNH